MFKRKKKPVSERAQTPAEVQDDYVRGLGEDAKKGSLGETVSTVVWALGIALVLRTFIFQPFTIPTGSMYPGLMEGDYVITSKYSVGYGRYAALPFPFPDVDGRLFGRGPERGDVIVFRPDGVNQNYIKRVIGLPGERIQMIDGVLHINDQPVSESFLRNETYQHRNQFGDITGSYNAELISEQLPDEDEPHLIYDAVENNRSDNTSVFTVRAGHYFMMGDNRDFSGDSRVPTTQLGAGQVPAENIIGRAEFVLLSVNENFSLIRPWTWGNMRGGRFFKGIE